MSNNDIFWKLRCTNKNVSAYSHYGGRGIGVCEKWLTFEGFFEDMGHCPEGHEIDRIDVNKGYSLENCRWVKKLVNCVNQRKRNLRKIKNTPRGVYYRKGKYVPIFYVFKKQYTLGRFDNEKDARLEYEKMALEWWGFIPN